MLVEAVWPRAHDLILAEHAARPAVSLHLSSFQLLWQQRVLAGPGVHVRKRLGPRSANAERDVSDGVGLGQCRCRDQWLDRARCVFSKFDGQDLGYDLLSLTSAALKRGMGILQRSISTQGGARRG